MATGHEGYKDNLEANGSPVRVYAPHELSPELKDLVHVLQKLEGSETAAGVSEAVALFDEDAIVDAPYVFIQGKERIRVILSVFNQFLTRRIQPQVVRVHTVNKRLLLEIDADIVFHVTRQWWLPATYLAPDLTVQGTFSLDVKTWTEKIARLTARLHNLPPFMPFLARYTIGWVSGSMGVVAEPAILKALEFFTSTATQTADMVLSAPPVKAVVESDTMHKVTESANTLVGQAQDVVTKVVDKVT